jgi:predicted membrane channel-forming protein YqfA (hemolysin III family)
MAAGACEPRYSVREEIANSVVHGAGALLTVAGLAPLLAAVPARGFALLLAGGIAYTAGVAFFLAILVAVVPAVPV